MFKIFALFAGNDTKYLLVLISPILGVRIPAISCYIEQDIQQPAVQVLRSSI
jgi:hypothetical protein